MVRTNNMILYRLLLILNTCILAALSCMSIFSRGAVNFETFSEHITFVPQSIPLLTAGIIAAVLFSCAVFHVLSGKDEHSQRRISNTAALLCSAAAFFGALVWARINPYPPAADQFTLWDASSLITAGEDISLYSAYIQSYPYQKGMILFLVFLQRIFGQRALFLFHVLNAASYGLLIPLCGGFARRLSGSRAAAIIADVLAMLFAPPLFYVPFIYGTLPSLALNFLGFHAVLESLGAAGAPDSPEGDSSAPSGGMPLPARSLAWAAASAVCFSLSYLLYTASLIAITASALTFAAAAVCLLSDRIKKGASAGRMAIAFAVALIAVVLLPALVQIPASSAFFFQTGIADSDGIPASAYLYMGISSDDGAAGPGSHNGRDIGLFSENDMDTARTDTAARALIAETLSEYAAGERSLSFFTEKTRWQWTDPWFSSLVLTIHPRSISVSWNRPFTFVVQSGLLSAIECFLAFLLPLVYIAALIGALSLSRKPFSSREDDAGQKNRGSFTPSVLLMLYFCGGFVFQLLWEAKARYCLPYFTALLPFAACGILRSGIWLNAVLFRTESLDRRD